VIGREYGSGEKEIHHRDTENTEKAQRNDLDQHSLRLSLKPLCDLRALRVSVVNNLLTPLKFKLSRERRAFLFRGGRKLW
jgi:hypothetical protein